MLALLNNIKPETSPEVELYMPFKSSDDMKTIEFTRDSYWGNHKDDDIAIQRYSKALKCAEEQMKLGVCRIVFHKTWDKSLSDLLDSEGFVLKGYEDEHYLYVRGG